MGSTASSTASKSRRGVGGKASSKGAGSSSGSSSARDASKADKVDKVYKERGESSTGSRLSSVALTEEEEKQGKKAKKQEKDAAKPVEEAAAKEQEEAAKEKEQEEEAKKLEEWGHDFDKLKAELGTDVGAHGDGFCWLYAFLGGLNVLERPERPTERDYALVRRLLVALKSHVRAGLCNNFLSEPQRAKFLSLQNPPVQRLSAENYGSVALELTVVAHYTGIPIFIHDPLQRDRLPETNDGSTYGTLDRGPAFTLINTVRSVPKTRYAPRTNPRN